MDIQLIPATNIDLDYLLDLQEAFYAIDQYPFHREKAALVLQDFLQKPELGSMYLIKNQGESIGYGALTYCYSFEFGGRIAFLDEFYIREAFRNKGLGSQALALVLEKCREQQLKVIHLEAERHNLAGKAIYHKFGFQDHDRHLMTKKLS